MTSFSRRSALSMAWSLPAVAVAVAVPAASASAAGARIELISAPVVPLSAETSSASAVVLRRMDGTVPGAGSPVTMELPNGLFHRSSHARTLTQEADSEGLVAFTVDALPLARAGEYEVVARSAEGATLQFRLDVAVREQPMRIMPLGDSITLGTGSGAQSFQAGYRSFLQGRLQDSGIAFDMVGTLRSGGGGIDPDHEGHWGWTSAQLLQGTQGWFAAKDPEIVFLHIGTNDAFWNRDPDGVGGRVRSMISQLQGKRETAVVFVALIVPSTDPVAQARVDRVNSSILASLPTGDERVRIVDMRTLLARGNFVDSLHPNDSGYALMGAAFADALIL